MLQLRVRRSGQKAFGHQSGQLLGGVGGCVGGVFAVFDLALGGGKLHQDAAGQARHFAGDQRQAGAAFVHALLELGFARGQRFDQKGAVERDFDDLGAQLFEGAAARVVGGTADQHVGGGHLLQLGQVLFKVLERVFDLQREQATQAGAVLGRGHIGLVKDFDGDRVVQVEQRRKADQRLAAFADFHELGQLAEGPGGVALAGGFGWRAGRRVGRWGRGPPRSSGGNGFRARVCLCQIGV